MAVNLRSKSRPVGGWGLRISYAVCTVGLILSLYAWFGRLAKERDASYESLHDISSTVSSSKALGSRYGRGFGLIDRVLPASSRLNLPNGAILCAYYIAQAAFASSSSVGVSGIQLLASCLSVGVSVYLFYILRYVLHYHCILCYLIHITNYCFFFCSLYKFLSVRRSTMSNDKEH